MTRSAVAFACLGLALAGLAAAADPEAVGPAKAGYDEALTDLRKEYKTRMAVTAVEYGTRLDEIVDKATQAGDLDGVLQIKAEQARLAKGGGEKAGKLPAEGVKARQALDTATDKARAVFVVQAREVHSKYLRELAELEKAETKAGRIESAVAVRAFR